MKFKIRHFAILSIGLIGCSISYKFEANQKKYSSFFPKKEPDGLSYPREMDYHNNYLGDASSLSSIRFPSSDSRTWINIEHLVKVVDYDLKLLKDLSDKHYMFSAIEIHPELKITKIKVNHSYNGRPLAKRLKYIYTFPRKPDGTIDQNQYFNVNKIESDSINTKGQFIYVIIYKIPISKFKMFVLPKLFWFGSGMKEEIEIEYIENESIKSKKYEFELEWTRREHWIT